MVPNGWQKTDLNRFIDIKHGFAFKSAYFRDEGDYILLTPGSFYETGGFKVQGEKTKYYVGEIPENYLLSKDDLLLAMTEQAAGLLGSTLFVPEDNKYLHNQRLGKVQIKVKNEICSEFLYLSYNSPAIRKQVSEQSTGTKVKHTSPDKLKSVVCLLPPLPEQRKIAKILSTWDKAISTNTLLSGNSKQQKKALMQQLLTGKKRLLDDSGKPFDAEWKIVTLEQVAKYRRGSFPQPYGNPEWEDKVNGYPFVQVYDIDKNMKLKPSTKFKISDAAIGKSVFIPKETIIISLQGSIGRVAITQYDAYVDRTVLLFQEFLAPMNKVFFAYVIQELFEIEKTKAPGGTIKTITKDVLSNFKILIPSLEEQQKIADVLTNVDKEIGILEQQLAALKQEKKALMQQLLTGKRRVLV